MKARRAEEVRFERLIIHSLRSSCRISVVITCYRFLQRLRLSVHNWCNQQASSGSYEVLVVNPGSPDGTHEFLAAVAGAILMCEWRNYRSVSLKGCSAFIFITRSPGSAPKRFYEFEESVG